MKPKKSRYGALVRGIIILLLGALAVGVPRLFDALDGLKNEMERRKRAGERMQIEDTSVYAADDAYRLYGYTRYAWLEDRPVGEYTYDVDGYLTHGMTWEYDAAGNLICECEGNDYEELKAGTNRRVFVYDEQNRVICERIYEWGVIREECFYRYVPEGCACARYIYQIGTGADWSLAYHETILYKENGDELCCMEYDRNGEVYHTRFSAYDDAGRLICQTGDENGQAWTYLSEWTDLGNYIQENTVYHSQAKKQVGPHLHNPQAVQKVERYRYDPDTGDAKLLLRQENFQDGKPRDVYEAAYDGDLLLWEVCCVSGKPEYFTVMSYDESGLVREERGCAQDAGGVCLRILRRYTYDGAGRPAAMYDYNDKNTALCGKFGKNGESGYGEAVFADDRERPSAITIYNADGSVWRQFVFDRNGEWVADDGSRMREAGTGAYDNKRGSEKYGDHWD